MRRSRSERLAAALSMLDERFDRLITGSSPVERLPEVMDELARNTPWAQEQLLHCVTY